MRRPHASLRIREDQHADFLGFAAEVNEAGLCRGNLIEVFDWLLEAGRMRVASGDGGAQALLTPEPKVEAPAAAPQEAPKATEDDCPI